MAEPRVSEKEKRGSEGFEWPNDGSKRQQSWLVSCLIAHHKGTRMPFKVDLFYISSPVDDFYTIQAGSALR